ncbi:hypothetical protein [Mycolicibacterium pulveris]|uniref:hypothetical protein n=1 Tax=Mycolicibacterium pulveris TaxID=36813 RepID=UPI003CEDEB60
MTIKHMATCAAVSGAAGLAALFLSNGVAAADPVPPAPPHEPGVVAAAENPPPEERREEPAKDPCKGPWCEVINAAKQLPPPDFSGVDVPKLAEVSVPVSFGVGLPDVVPDIGIPVSFPLPDFQLPPPPAVGVPQLQAPKVQLPGPPKIGLPKLGPPKLPF